MILLERVIQGITVGIILTVTLGTCFKFLMLELFLAFSCMDDIFLSQKN